MPCNLPELEAHNLECIRGERLLFSGLSFKLKAGELLYVEGANGRGKTSLLRILCGLSQPAEGEVHWCGQPISNQRYKFYQDLAYLGHHLGVKGELTALENLTLASRLYCIRQDVDLGQILIRAGLSGCAETPARALSAGQRQRLALARLLLQEATLWILDEPFTALDQNGIAWVHALLEEHLAYGGMIVMSSHQPVALATQQVLTLKL